MIDLEYLRRWVGREQTVTDDLHPFRAQGLAAALDHAASPDAGDLLPPAWQWLYFLDTPRASATGADGHPKLGGFLPPDPLPRRMWAGGAMQIERPLRLGCPASRHSTIRAVEAKTGKSGSLVLVTLDHVYAQNGQVCLHEEQNLVYRDMPAGPAPLPPGEPAPLTAQWSCRVCPDPTLLFRYSALTYNSHRIHYDRQYAIQQEFYPALVVQGPLLATLLLDVALAPLPYVNTVEFRFRALRPSFDTQPFNVCGRQDGEKLELWTADPDGQVCMTASARLA